MSLLDTSAVQGSTGGASASAASERDTTSIAGGGTGVADGAGGAREPYSSRTMPNVSMPPLVAVEDRDNGPILRVPAPKPRGRPPGSTLIERDKKRLLELAQRSHPAEDEALAEAEPPTKSSKCRAAVVARWDRYRSERERRDAEENHDLGVVFSGQSARGAVHAIVSVDAVRSGTPLAANLQLQQAYAAVDPDEFARMQLASAEVVGRICIDTGAWISTRVAAERLDISDKTIARKTTLQAFFICVYKRHAAQQAILGFQKELEARVGCDKVRPLYWADKYKYDEMTLRVTTKQGGEQESTLHKLLQVTVSWSALWRVGDAYCQMVIKIPSTVRAIESCNATCMTAGLARQVETPAVARALFDDRASLPHCDSHGANELADDALWEQGRISTQSKWPCRVHKVDKVLTVIMRVFPTERRGLFHAVMAFDFAGTFTKFKRNFKQWLQQRLVVRPWGVDGPGAAANAHREFVYDAFLRGKQTDDPLGVANASKAARIHLTERLVNGDIRKQNTFEHFCRGWPGCCRSPQHTLDLLCSEWVGHMPRPRVWRKDDWGGFVDTADWFACLGATHNCLPEVFEMTFPAKARKADAPAAIPMPVLEDGAHHGAPAAVPDADLDLPEPAKEATDMERQTTYRANASLWLSSAMLPRLWQALEVARGQQQILDSFFAQAGDGWVGRELLRRKANKEPQYRVLQFASGEHTKKSFDEWGLHATSAQHWRSVPESFCSHDLACASYRAAASASALTFQLVQIPAETSGAAEFLIMRHEGTVRQRLVAMKLLQQYAHTPCVLDHWWYEHCRRYPTVDSLLSPDAMAKVAAQAELVEVENVDTEARNARLRKLATKALQQKRKSLADVSASWVIQEEKAEAGMWQDAWDCDQQASDEDVGTQQQRRSTCGGRFRAFVSKLSREHKLINGKPDLKTICAKYREALQSNSELLQECAQRGAQATRLGRLAAAGGANQNARATSAFGTSLSLAKRKSAALGRRQVALADCDACEELAASSSAALALPSKSSMLSRLVVGRHANLQEQCDRLRSYAHALRQRALRGQRDSEDALHTHVRAPQRLADVSLADVRLPPHDCPIRIFVTGSVAKIVPELGALKFAAKRVTALDATRTQLPHMALRLWDKEHELTTDAGAPPVNSVSAGYRKSLCFVHGHGRCLCSGHGLIKRMAMRRFAAAIASRCPKDSLMRKLLQSSFLVVSVQSLWYHIAICYLQPRRPTFVKMTKRSELIWGREVVDPVLAPGTTQFEHWSEVDFIEQFDLEGPVKCALYRFVTFERRFQPWFPSARLTIEPLDGPFAFWKGREQEVADANARAAAAERRRSRRQNKTRSSILPPGPGDEGDGRAPGTTPAATRATRQAPKPPQGLALPALEDASDSEDEVGEALEHGDLRGFWSGCLEDGRDGAGTSLGVLQDVIASRDGEPSDEEVGSPRSDIEGEGSVIAPGSDDGGSVIAPGTRTWYDVEPPTPPTLEASPSERAPAPPRPEPEPEDLAWFDELMNPPAAPPNSNRLDGAASTGSGAELEDIPLSFITCPWLAPYDPRPEGSPATGAGDLPMPPAEPPGDASGASSSSAAARPPPVEPPGPPDQPSRVAAAGGYRAPSALAQRDSLQPPGCILRKYSSADGKGCYWEGRGPRPERLSRSRQITASRSETEVIGEIEAWLLTKFGEPPTQT